MPKINLNFRNEPQREFFTSTLRNVCGSGGFGSGKTYVACQGAVLRMATFPNYRVAIARFEESKLKQTTMQTFFKPDLCDPALYDTNYGGNRADSMNQCTFINKSKVLWMNLKETDDGVIRGLEVNEVIIDQAEEIAESQYLLLSPRAGRWDQAEVPPELLAQNPNWPISENTRKPKVPELVRILCNPDSELHWIWRRYHPDSPIHREKYYKNYKMIQFPTTTETVSETIMENYLENEQVWVDRFVHGKWGIPGGQIHTVCDDAILNPDDPDVIKFLETAKSKGYLYRAMDHGDSAPTCVLWFCAFGPYLICYREYYQPDRLISYHRRAIADLSAGEKYVTSWADPDIFREHGQKHTSRWTVAKEYCDTTIDAPILSWQPASNDEFACRSAVAEVLKRDFTLPHPITGIVGAPRLYFINQTTSYPQGCQHVQRQTKSQKRKKLGSVDGKDFYSDERAEGVEDHAYDPLRYFCVEKANAPAPKRPRVRDGSFLFHRDMIRHRNSKYRVVA